MKPPSQAPSLGVPNNRPAWCAQFPLKPTVRFQPRLKISLLPPGNYNRTHPALVSTNSSIYSRSLSPKTNTIEYA
jgi:hypothetical protein